MKESPDGMMPEDVTASETWPEELFTDPYFESFNHEYKGSGPEPLRGKEGGKKSSGALGYQRSSSQVSGTSGEVSLLASTTKVALESAEALNESRFYKTTTRFGDSFTYINKTTMKVLPMNSISGLSKVINFGKGAASVTGNFFSYFSIALDVISVANEDISLARGAYRIGGSGLGLYIVASTSSTGIGIAVGVSVMAAEKAYDYFESIVAPILSDGIRASGQSISVPFPN